MNAKNIFYVLTCISFCLILGAATYEHIAVWPNAYSEPPRSLTMFQGPYALESAPFWMWVHPVTLLLFLATLGLNWRTEKKKYILLPLAVYFLVLATTFIYFVPELMSLTHTPYADTVDVSVQERAGRWTSLSLVRAAFLYVSAFLLLMGLTRPEKKIHTVS